MIYTIKFIYQFLLPPGIFVIAFLVMGICLIRTNRKLAIANILLAMACYFVSIPYGAAVLNRSLETVYIQPKDIKADVVVVLTGSTDRITNGIALAKQYNLPLIISGGPVHEDDVNESPRFYQLAIRAGITPKYIIIEDKSINTTQSVRYVKDILRTNSWSSPVVVTSYIHMPRSMMIFEHYDLVATAFPIGRVTGINKQHRIKDFAPKGLYIDSSATALKEYLGIVSLYFGYGRL